MAGSTRVWILDGTLDEKVEFCCSVGYHTSSLKVSKRDDIRYLLGTRLNYWGRRDSAVFMCFLTMVLFAKKGMFPMWPV